MAGPERLALLRARVGVVLEQDGRRIDTVLRVVAQTADTALVRLPIRGHNGTALRAEKRGGGLAPIVRRRGRAAMGCVRCRRRHPSSGRGGWESISAGVYSVAVGERRADAVQTDM